MPRPQAPRVVDRSSVRTLRAWVAWGTGIEAVISLVMLSSREGLDRYESGVEMERSIRRGLPASVSRAINSLRSPAGDAWAALIGLVANPDQDNDVSAVIGRLEKIDATDLKLSMMGLGRTQGKRSTQPEEILRIADREGWIDEATPVAKVAAPELRQMVLETLKDLPADLYRTSNMETLLERNGADAQRLLIETDDPRAVIERLTHGLVYRPEPGITDALLIPSLIHRPFTRLLDHESTKIFCYPARLEAELTAPDDGLIAVYRALGDGTRLRILRRLAAGTTPVARLSEEIGLAKSTVHEHLLSLRSAGLVRMSASGGFELQPELPDLNWKLKEFLGLEMRRACEGCGIVLEPDGVAYICSYECTYCDECARSNELVCPTCSGELVIRPRRTKATSGPRPRPRSHSAERALPHR